MIARAFVGSAAAIGLLAIASPRVAAQVVSRPSDTRETLAALQLDPLAFEPPKPDAREIDGVEVLLLEDRSLPLVSVYARFRGGYGLFDREWYAAAMALPSLLRYGGTSDLTPDSVDYLIDYYAISTSFGTGGGSVTSTVNVLTEQLDPAVELWQHMLVDPRFDPEQIELWRGRELESLRRRADDPGSLAFSEFNRLMYGNHPIGWRLGVEDLEPDLVSQDRFREMHRRIICRDNLVLGVAGDISWQEFGPLADRLVASIPPCSEPLPRAPVPEIRREPGVFLIDRELEQAVVVMAHPASVRLEDAPGYYAATIGNSILGAGGFSSRLLGRVRTEEGLAYSASSIWTTPRRYDGLIGAITRTRPESAGAAIDLILSTMNELTEKAPTEAEVRTAVDAVVNGFVFNFDSPGEIVSRTMVYVAEGLPDDWLQRYANGVQRVGPDEVLRVFADHLRPEDMTILIVGDLDRVGRNALASLGPLTILDPS